MTYHKPLVQALETDVLLASCCPCNPPNDDPGLIPLVPGGNPGGTIPIAPPGAPCYVSVAGICLF